VNRAAAAAASVLLGLAVAACDGLLATTPTATPGTGTNAPASATATAQPPTSFGPPPSPTPPDDASPITVDPELLAFLPESIDGAPFQEDLDVASEALLDPALPNIASGVDAAVAVDAGNINLVTAWVVRLRPGKFGEEAYRQWRDSYDEGACSAAGGVVGSANVDIADRDAWITTCVAALRTYHVWLEDEGVLVSAFSIGEGKFGEKLMENLRIPAS